MIIIFVSFENEEDAEKVANYLVDKKLAVCVTLFPVESFYYWKGKKFEGSREFEAIVKTKKQNFAKIQKAVEELLSYEVPQLIAVDTKAVNKKYLGWLEKETK